jgi:putative PIG3 family NAD(P)H quinone oxidoreductase
MSDAVMQAVVMREPGGPEVLELREVPRPEPGPGEILVEVVASGINRADVLQRQGLYPAPEGWPADIPGLEFAGRVARCGPGTGLFDEGEAVMGLVGGGGYARYVVLPEREVLPAPEGLHLVETGALPEAFLTAFDACFVQMGLTAGETLLIHAVGSGVGTAALQLAKAAGVRTVGTSRTPDKLEAAEALGLDHGVLADTPEGWLEGVRAATGGRGADVILDLVGGPYLPGNVKAVAERGRIVCVGIPGGRRAELDIRRLMGRRASLTGTVLRARPGEEKALLAREASRRLVPLFESAALRPVIDRTYAPGAAGDAHRRMDENLNFGKLLLVWEE